VAPASSCTCASTLAERLACYAKELPLILMMTRHDLARTDGGSPSMRSSPVLVS
jgi:hypothetical protein